MVTKENVAAHEIAEHLVALQLLAQQLMGRLVGYYEQRRVENRNHHTRQKSLLIGCEGAFNRNVDSHIAQCLTGSSRLTWVLEDEGQQYGNMEEAATTARTPCACFEIWSGDHRHIPGGPAANRGGQVPPQIAQAAVGATVSNTLRFQFCENHARKMRTFCTRRLEPKTRSSYHIKWSNAK